MTSLQEAVVQKPRKLRSTSGCIGCRLRRKKCSEEKPHCANCVRNGILCTWPDANNSKHAELLRRTNLTHRVSKSPKSIKIEAGDGQQYGDRSSPRSPSAASTPSSPSSVDETSSGGLVFDFAILDVLNTIPQSLDPFALLSNNILRQSPSKRLFYHYLQRTHKIMAICQGSKNPFILELIPMAMSNDLILNSLLAFSGIHYADSAKSPVDEVTWLHYGHAVRDQKFGLTLLAQGRKEMIVPLLMAAMVLCTVESFRVGAGAVALQHLKAARHLLQEALRLSESQLSRRTRAFLIERYTYTMILAHITMGAESDQWVLDDAALLFPIMESAMIDSREATSSCVHELFQLIPKVSVLARQRQRQLHEGQLSPDCWHTTSEYLDTYRTIESWTPSSQDVVHTLCGRLYQQALLVYLASSFPQPGSFLEGSDSDYPPQIQHAFDNFIPFLQSIPLDSSISTTLCWPLAIFGSCARSTEHREIIRARLDSLSTMYAAQSVRDTRRLLEILWAENDPAKANPLSFEHIMRREKMTVLFL